MAIVVVGGHSRNVGKTSVVAALIAALRDREWMAVKITQYGHGICSAHGEPCDCAPSALDHEWAINQEHNAAGPSDTARFLAAGARSALWVRTRQGRLAEAMPELRRRIAGHASVIMESNSVVRFLRPDLYLAVLDPATADFKASAREFLDRADALLVHECPGPASWSDVSLSAARGAEVFQVRPPDYCPLPVAEFVRRRLANLPSKAAEAGE